MRSPRAARSRAIGSLRWSAVTGPYQATLRRSRCITFGLIRAMPRMLQVASSARHRPCVQVSSPQICVTSRRESAPFSVSARPDLAQRRASRSSVCMCGEAR